jgi:hypothetical protein
MLGDPIEDGAPALLGSVVILGAHVPTLLEDYLGSTVAEVVEDDGDEFVDLIRLVRDRQDEALRRDDLEILPLPRRSGPANIVAHHAPPGLTSIETVEMGTSDSGPPNQSADGSGSVHSPHTRSRARRTHA